MNRAACPTHATLELLCGGAIPSERELEIYAHVDDCVACQKTLDKLTGTTESGVHLSAGSSSQESETLAERLDELKTKGRPPALSGDRLFRDLSPWFDAVTDNEEAIGRIDEYELLECVGRGGMGIVFRAHDSKLTRNVALKVMSPSLLADATAPARFLREAQAAARINHPNVVTLFAVSEVKELPYIAMEFVDGESLQELLDQRGKLDVDEAITIAKQISAGLAAAHEAGVVHRDIKPANVLIGSEAGHVKLTDFGLARSLDGTQFTASGFLVGTPEFVAPEQIDSGHPVDHRADLFSLGSLLYRLVTDRTPFASNSTFNTLAQIGQTEPQEIRSINEDVPQWLAVLVHRLLAKDPEDRPRDASAVSRALEQRSVDTLTNQSSESRFLHRNQSRSPVATQKNTLNRILKVAAIGIVTFLCAFLWRVWRDDQPVKIATAEELVLHYDDNSEHEDLSIVLTSNQPYLLEPIFVEGRNLVLRSAKGIEPKLIFELDEVQTCIEVIEGRLEISGITIETKLTDDSDHDIPSDDEDDDIVDDDANEDFESDKHDRIALVNCEHGSITLTDCRIVSQDCACLRAEGASCELNNCDLHAIGDACLLIDSASEDVLALTNCLLVGEDNVYFCHADDLTIDLTNNTLIGEVGFNLGEIESEHYQFAVAATRNVFDVTTALFNVDGDTSYVAGLIEDDQLRWEGHTNLYTGPFIKTSENADSKILRGLAKWRELTDSSESKSKVSMPEYEIERAVLADETMAKSLDRDALEFDSDEGYGIQSNGIEP